MQIWHRVYNNLISETVLVYLSSCTIFQWDVLLFKKKKKKIHHHFYCRTQWIVIFRKALSFQRIVFVSVPWFSTSAGVRLWLTPAGFPPLSCYWRSAAVFALISFAGVKQQQVRPPLSIPGSAVSALLLHDTQAAQFKRVHRQDEGFLRLIDFKTWRVSSFTGKTHFDALPGRTLNPTFRAWEIGGGV